MHGKCRYLRVYYHVKGVDYGASARSSNRVYKENKKWCCALMQRSASDLGGRAT